MDGKFKPSDDLSVTLSGDYSQQNPYGFGTAFYKGQTGERYNPDFAAWARASSVTAAPDSMRAISSRRITCDMQQRPSRDFVVCRCRREEQVSVSEICPPSPA